jgi:hypothetical protein
MCRVPRKGIPKARPMNLSLAHLPTKSLWSKSMRWGDRPSPRRASLWGGANDQTPTTVATRRNITEPRPDRTYSTKRPQADTIEHPRVQPRKYPHWVMGPVNSISENLSTGVSTVTLLPERMRQYSISDVYLRMLDSDTRGMMKNEQNWTRSWTLP